MDVKAAILKHVDIKIDFKGLLIDEVIHGIVVPAIDKFVADTATPFDDTVKDLLLPIILKEVEAKIAELDVKAQEKLAELKA